MTIEIARIDVTLLYPGAVLEGRTLIDWTMGHPRFHTHRIALHDQIGFVVDEDVETITLGHPCQLVRVVPIGDTIIGVASGVMDHLMMMKGLAAVLGPSVKQIVQLATAHAPLARDCKTQIAWLALFEVDETKEEAIYLGRLEFETLTAFAW